MRVLHRPARMPAGRGLISTKPNPDTCELDEGEIVGCEFIVACGDAPTLLDLVEEPLDQVTRSTEVRAKADRGRAGKLCEGARLTTPRRINSTGVGGEAAIARTS